MSRGPSKPTTSAPMPVMSEDCPNCPMPRDQHRPIAVHVCYSDRVIHHWMCPDEMFRLVGTPAPNNETDGSA